MQKALNHLLLDLVVDFELVLDDHLEEEPNEVLHLCIHFLKEASLEPNGFFVVDLLTQVVELLFKGPALKLNEVDQFFALRLYFLLSFYTLLRLHL